MPPRDSILNLFDPLNSSAPFRDAPSPDSDKENSSVTDFSFFGRVPDQPSPVRLKRRLIDIGDITTDDPTMLSMLTDEEELDNSMCDDENDTFTLPPLDLPTTTPVRAPFVQHTTPSNATPRTPLGDISLDRDITPMGRTTKMYRRPPPTSGLTSLDAVSAENSSFASVIDAVTSSGASFACSANPSPEPNDQPHDDLVNEVDSPNSSEHDIETPHITVTSTDELSNSTSTLSLDALPEDPSLSFTFPPLSEPSDTSIDRPQATLRPNPPKTSSHDPNRYSIDLYSSFQLQLQSEEASFDLLNDNISLFGPSSSMDSFLNGTEEDISFDMGVEEAKLQATIETIEWDKVEEKAGDMPVKSISTEQQDIEPIVHDSSTTSSPQSPPEKPAVPEVLRPPSLRSTPSSPVSHTFTKEQSNESTTTTQAITYEPTSKPHTPVFVPPSRDQGPAALRTPATHVPSKVLPVPVPALRIVKRSTRPGHEKSASSSSASLAASEGLAVASVPLPITRNASSSVVTSNRLATNRSVGSGPSAALPSTRTGTGPRRVPIVERQSETKLSQHSIVGQKTQAGISGPRRVAISTPSVPGAVAPVGKVTAVSGIKVTAKYGVGNGAAVSGLPRPVSRLPTSTSSLARPRPVVGASIGTSGTAVQGPGIVRRSAPARRGAE